MPKVLILTASIGAGHDLPAELLAGALRRRGVTTETVDGLTAMGPLVERSVMSGTSYDSTFGNRAYDVAHVLGSELPPTRRLAGRLAQTAGGGRLLRLVGDQSPGVVVSTYPVVTEALGRLRRAGRLHVPIVSAITDLASLRLWAHPDVDLHLITHPESADEVRRIAGAATAVVAVRGFNPVGFEAPPERATARAALELPAGPVVLVSGGGWGVGDVAGAAGVALTHGQVLVLCGSNEALLSRMQSEPGIRALGFTTRMPELMAAADVLVHSTAGLTVLEALICGCRVISYGWGRGHIRINNAAFERHGLARVAGTRASLDRALSAALAAPRTPDRSWFSLPWAADVIVDRFPVLQQTA